MKNMMRRITLSILLLSSMACILTLNVTPTLSPQDIQTMSAQTLNAILHQTQAAGGNTTPGIIPANTDLPAVPTYTGTNPPPPAATFTPTVTATPVPCNWVQFISDVTIADNWETSPADHFTKTWRLKNIGSCTWTSGYSLVFDHGDQMSAPASQQLTAGTVAPGATIDVSVNLLSPATPGTYQGYFKLRASDATIFGIGPAADGAFWVKIVVAGGSGGLAVQQLEASTAIAMGSTGHVSVNCPAGSVIVGGGFDGGNNIATYRSERSGNGWLVYAHRYMGANGTLRAFAYCLSGVSASSTSGYTEKTLAPGASGEQSYGCTGGSKVTGGGFAFTDGVIWAYRLIMAGNGLLMNAQNQGASNGTFRPHPVCLTAAGETTVRGTNTGSIAAASSGTLEAGCPDGTTVTGGGFTLANHMTLTGLYKKPGENKWMMRALNQEGSSMPAAADAICLAIS